MDIVNEAEKDANYRPMNMDRVQMPEYYNAIGWQLIFSAVRRSVSTQWAGFRENRRNKSTPATFTETENTKTVENTKETHDDTIPTADETDDTVIVLHPTCRPIAWYTLEDIYEPEAGAHIEEHTIDTLLPEGLSEVPQITSIETNGLVDLDTTENQQKEDTNAIMSINTASPKCIVEFPAANITNICCADVDRFYGDAPQQLSGGVMSDVLSSEESSTVLHATSMDGSVDLLMNSSTEANVTSATVRDPKSASSITCIINESIYDMVTSETAIADNIGEQSTDLSTSEDLSMALVVWNSEQVPPTSSINESMHDMVTYDAVEENDYEEQLTVLSTFEDSSRALVVWSMPESDYELKVLLSEMYELTILLVVTLMVYTIVHHTIMFLMFKKYIILAPDDKHIKYVVNEETSCNNQLIVFNGGTLRTVVVKLFLKHNTAGTIEVTMLLQGYSSEMFSVGAHGASNPVTLCASTAVLSVIQQLLMACGNNILLNKRDDNLGYEEVTLLVDMQKFMSAANLPPVSGMFEICVQPFSPNLSLIGTELSNGFIMPSVATMGSFDLCEHGLQLSQVIENIRFRRIATTLEVSIMPPVLTSVGSFELREHGLQLSPIFQNINLKPGLYVTPSAADMWSLFQVDGLTGSISLHIENTGAFTLLLDSPQIAELQASYLMNMMDSVEMEDVITEAYGAPAAVKVDEAQLLLIETPNAEGQADVNEPSIILTASAHDCNSTDVDTEPETLLANTPEGVDKADTVHEAEAVPVERDERLIVKNRLPIDSMDVEKAKDIIADGEADLEEKIQLMTHHLSMYEKNEDHIYEIDAITLLLDTGGLSLEENAYIRLCRRRLIAFGYRVIQPYSQTRQASYEEVTCINNYPQNSQERRSKKQVYPIDAWIEVDDEAPDDEEEIVYMPVYTQLYKSYKKPRGTPWRH